MLPSHTIKDVRRMLAKQHYSYREIAVLAGVSRSTVAHIAKNNQDPTSAGRTYGDLDSRKLERCKGCGGLVEMPCLLCQARRYREIMSPLPLKNSGHKTEGSTERHPPSRQ